MGARHLGMNFVWGQCDPHASVRPTTHFIRFLLDAVIHQEMVLPSIETVQAACEHAAKKFKDSGPIFVQDVYDSIKVKRVWEDSDGIPTVEFLVATPEKFNNSMEMVHGGASSTFCAVFSTLALAGDMRWWPNSTPSEADLDNFVDNLGYSRALDVQIMQAVPLRSEVYVRGQILSRTKSNAYVVASIYNKSGKLLVRAFHDMIQRSYEPKNPKDPRYNNASFYLTKL